MDGSHRRRNQQAIITAGESDELSRKLSIKSSQGGYKVSLIWLPERMNAECANKLLKLIEEPPSQTVFIMVCEEPDKLLDTIRSRTQRIDIKRIDEASIRQALMERRGLDADTATRITRIANGSWLKAVGALDADNENEQFLIMFQKLMRLAYSRKVKELKQWSEAMQTMGREKQKRFLAYFLRLVRENFAYNFMQPELNYMTQQEEDFARNFARFVNEKKRAADERAGQPRHTRHKPKRQRQDCILRHGDANDSAAAGQVTPAQRRNGSRDETTKPSNHNIWTIATKNSKYATTAIGGSAKGPSAGRTGN